MLEPADRARIAAAAGRRGGLTNIARNGGQAPAKVARAGFMRRFELQVDPDGTLPPEERASRARYALKAHMANLALRSAQARRKDVA